MFDHLIEVNQLEEDFKRFDLGEEDITFIKELIYKEEKKVKEGNCSATIMSHMHLRFVFIAKHLVNSLAFGIQYGTFTPCLGNIFKVKDWSYWIEYVSHR